MSNYNGYRSYSGIHKMHRHFSINQEFTMTLLVTGATGTIGRLGGIAHEGADTGAARSELGDDEAADGAGGTGNEYGHGELLVD